MFCNVCGGEMEREERVNDTRYADISIEVVYVCPECSNEYKPQY